MVLNEIIYFSVPWKKKAITILNGSWLYEHHTRQSICQRTWRGRLSTGVSSNPFFPFEIQMTFLFNKFLQEQGIPQNRYETEMNTEKQEGMRFLGARETRRPPGDVSGECNRLSGFSQRQPTMEAEGCVHSHAQQRAHRKHGITSNPETQHVGIEWISSEKSLACFLKLIIIYSISKETC